MKNMIQQSYIWSDMRFERQPDCFRVILVWLRDFVGMQLSK